MDTEEQHFGGDFTLLVFFINVSKTLFQKLSLGQHGAGLRPAGQSHRHDAGGGLEAGCRQTAGRGTNSTIQRDGPTDS